MLVVISERGERRLRRGDHIFVFKLQQSIIQFKPPFINYIWTVSFLKFCLIIRIVFKFREVIANIIKYQKMGNCEKSEYYQRKKRQQQGQLDKNDGCFSSARRPNQKQQFPPPKQQPIQPVSPLFYPPVQNENNLYKQSLQHQHYQYQPDYQKALPIQSSPQISTPAYKNSYCKFISNYGNSCNHSECQRPIDFPSPHNPPSPRKSMLARESIDVPNNISDR